MTYELVKYSQSGAVAVIEQNRPDKRNAQNQQMLTEIEAALDRAANDASVRVIIIGGIGGHFSAGHDLREGEEIQWAMIRALMASVADTVLIPMQDILGLGREARMNLPGRMYSNWKWRYTREQLRPEMAQRLRTLTELYER